MAYPYYPMNYPVYQPVIPQQVQAHQQSAPGIIWVSGLQEAQFYPVAPNSAVALWEQSGKTIYMKSADATGKPSMRIYDIVERVETAEKSDVEEYARKSELAQILSTLKDLTGDIEQMKGDLYGVAGRKKKKEVTEVDE